MRSLRFRQPNHGRWYFRSNDERAGSDLDALAGFRHEDVVAIEHAVEAHRDRRRQLVKFVQKQNRIRRARPAKNRSINKRHLRCARRVFAHFLLAAQFPRAKQLRCLGVLAALIAEHRATGSRTDLADHRRLATSGRSKHHQITLHLRLRERCRERARCHPDHHATQRVCLKREAIDCLGCFRRGSKDPNRGRRLVATCLERCCVNTKTSSIVLRTIASMLFS